jgi:hypothetical protein
MFKLYEGSTVVMDPEPARGYDGQAEWDNPPPVAPQADLYDWGDFRRHRDRYPHLAILGKTGAGKSWLAERLLTLLGGQVIAVAPHWQQGDYVAAHRVIGAGRDYGDGIMLGSNGLPLDASDFDAIMAGSPATVCGLLGSLLLEMDRRYQLDPDSGQRISGPMVNVILDEFPAYGSLPGVQQVMAKLLLEARKVNLRIVLLCQGAEVKTLGLDGRGSLREQMTWIRLRGFISGRDGVRRTPTGGIDLAALAEPERAYVLSQDRPCLVEEVPADLAELAQLELADPLCQPWQGDGRLAANGGQRPDHGPASASLAVSGGKGSPERDHWPPLADGAENGPFEDPRHGGQMARWQSEAQQGTTKTALVQMIRSDAGLTRAQARKLAEEILSCHG